MTARPRTVRPAPCRPARRVAALVAFALAVAVALAQLLGAVHRVDHAPAAAGAIRASALAAPAAHAHRHLHGTVHAHGATPAAPAADADLLPLADASRGAPADGTHDCAAFDHAAVADAAPAPALPPLEPARFGAAPAARPDAPALAAQAAGFLARGPPAA